MNIPDKLNRYTNQSFLSGNQTSTLWIILSVLIALCTLPFHITAIIGTRLDDSWIRAINMALHDKAVFGKDFIFPYGPLGFLETRNSTFLPAYLLFIFDFILLAGYFFQIKLYNDNKYVFIYLLFAVILLRFTNSFSIKLFILYIISLTTLINNKFKDLPSVVFIVLLAFISLLIKINYGLIAFFLLAISFIMACFNNRKAAAVLLVSTIIFGLITVLSLHINLPGYILWSLPLIEGYNEAMYVPIRLIDMEFSLALIDLAAFAFIAWRSFKQSAASLLTIIPFMLLVFLLFKNSFVRADSYHKYYFYSAFPFVLLFFSITTGLFTKIITRAVVLLSVSISFAALLYSGVFRIGKILPFNYFSAGVHELGDQRQEEDVLIPSLISNKIGRQTVDVFPIDITMAQVNNLNYKGRPVIQSYSAYTRSLDSINAAYIGSVGRPEFIIIRNDAIDKRYAVWDEGLTKAFIRHFYRFVDSFCLQNKAGLANSSKSFLLMQKKPFVNENYQPLRILLANENIQMGTPLLLHLAATEGPVYMSVSLQYNMAGNASKILFQPPVSEMKLSFSDNTDTTIKFIAPIANTPLLINKAVRNNKELINYMQDSLNKNADVYSIQFIKRKGWKENINISFFKLAE